jgi:hypothetical protein
VTSEVIDDRMSEYRYVIANRSRTETDRTGTGLIIYRIRRLLQKLLLWLLTIYMLQITSKNDFDCSISSH